MCASSISQVALSFFTSAFLYNASGRFTSTPSSSEGDSYYLVSPCSIRGTGPPLHQGGSRHSQDSQEDEEELGHQACFPKQPSKTITLGRVSSRSVTPVAPVGTRLSPNHVFRQANTWSGSSRPGADNPITTSSPTPLPTQSPWTGGDNSLDLGRNRSREDDY